MARGSLALPRVEPLRPGSKLLQYIPGVLLLGAIGYLGKLIEQSIALYAKSITCTYPILSTCYGPS